MIVAPTFVFLHLHKSGGSFVNECLLRHLPGAVQLGYHLPRRLVPLEHSGWPVLGTVRNPWSYYVSWYAFQRARRERNALFNTCSDSGRLGFAATIRNMLTLANPGGSELLDALLAKLPEKYTNHGLNLPAFALAPIARSGAGFYSYLYRYMYGGTGGHVHVVRMESLRTELLETLATIGQTVNPALRRAVGESAPTNASAHGAYQDYYDAQLRGLVGRRDVEVIDRHGYVFARSHSCSRVNSER